jgi:hypothetical protein
VESLSGKRAVWRLCYRELLSRLFVIRGIFSGKQRRLIIVDIKTSGEISPVSVVFSLLSDEIYIATMRVFLFILLAIVSANSNKTYIDLENFPGDACFRDCSKTDRRVCHFNWHLEHYHVLGP